MLTTVNYHAIQKLIFQTHWYELYLHVSLFRKLTTSQGHGGIQKAPLHDVHRQCCNRFPIISVSELLTPSNFLNIWWPACINRTPWGYVPAKALSKPLAPCPVRATHSQSQREWGSLWGQASIEHAWGWPGPGILAEDGAAGWGLLGSQSFHSPHRNNAIYWIPVSGRPPEVMRWGNRKFVSTVNENSRPSYIIRH